MTVEEVYNNYGVVHSENNCNVCEIIVEETDMAKKLSKGFWIFVAVASVSIIALGYAVSVYWVKFG